MNSIVKPIMFVFLIAAILPTYAATQTTLDKGTSATVSQQEKSVPIGQKMVVRHHHYRSHHHYQHQGYCGYRHHHIRGHRYYCRCQPHNYFYHHYSC